MFKNVLRDLALALAIGLGVGIVVLLFFALIGGLIAGSFLSGVSAGRSGVLICGSACLVFAAGLLLKGGNLPEEAFRFRIKKRQKDDVTPPAQLHLYRVVPRIYTTLTTAIGILFVSLIPDLILMRMG